MRGSHFTAEQNAFIAENYIAMTYPELAKCYNEKFGANMTASSIGKKIRYMGLPKKEPYSHPSSFTEEANSFLMVNGLKFTSAQLSKMLFEQFGISAATQTVTDQLNRLGIHRGARYLPDNYEQPNCKPVGTETIAKKTVMVKVAQPNVWMPKSQVIMGYDPQNEVPIYLDGNSLNCTKENIVVVSKRVHARLAKNGWLNSSNEVLLAGIKWAELLYAIKEVKDGD